MNLLCAFRLHFLWHIYTRRAIQRKQQSKMLSNRTIRLISHMCDQSKISEWQISSRLKLNKIRENCNKFHCLFAFCARFDTARLTFGAFLAASESPNKTWIFQLSFKNFSIAFVSFWANCVCTLSRLHAVCLLFCNAQFVCRTISVTAWRRRLNNLHENRERRTLNFSVDARSCSSCFDSSAFVFSASRNDGNQRSIRPDVFCFRRCANRD